MSSFEKNTEICIFTEHFLRCTKCTLEANTLEELKKVVFGYISKIPKIGFKIAARPKKIYRFIISPKKCLKYI